MTPDEARALFDAALDDELGPEERMEFDAVLAASPELQAELDELRALLNVTASLSATAPKVDVLAGVQSKLRARSGGRFYRDRFAQTSGRRSAITWLLSGSVLLLTIVVVWMVLGTWVSEP